MGKIKNLQEWGKIILEQLASDNVTFLPFDKQTAIYLNKTFDNYLTKDELQK